VIKVRLFFGFLNFLLGFGLHFLLFPVKKLIYFGLALVQCLDLGVQLINLVILSIELFSLFYSSLLRLLQILLVFLACLEIVLAGFHQHFFFPFQVSNLLNEPMLI